MKKASRETVLIGGREKREIKVVDYDPSWPRKFDEHARKIRGALGERALLIEHIGSTSVPGLAAKPIVDMDVVVADSSDEASYLPDLEATGYSLRVREPDWHEHRMFRTQALDVHIHVFSPESTEVKRHLLFRDHLIKNSEDRELYESTKRTLADRPWSDMNEYADAKSRIIEGILASAGWSEPRNKPV